MVHRGMLPRLDDTCMIESAVAELKGQLQGSKLMVTGDFNTKLFKTEGDPRGEEITEMLATEGLEDILTHVIPRLRSQFRDGRMWSMIR